MRWTSEAPTAPGWYWFRTARTTPAIYEVRPALAPGLFWVFTNQGSDWELSELLRYSVAPEWFGPLEVPA